MMKNDINTLLRRQVAALVSLDVEALRQKFHELYGFEAPNRFPDNIRRRITYTLQELYLGGLSDEDAAVLDGIAAKDPLSNLQTAPAKKMSKTVGTRFQRVWKGKTYEVTVMTGGTFLYDGKEYKSLSAIAGVITGGHWNGKLFFGVK
jgi:hypothetical protein